MRSFLLLLSVLLCTRGVPQDSAPRPGNDREGRFYFYWGWNRGWFSNSDIHFKGDGYDFTLTGVRATDRPTDFSVKTYFHPTYLAIPQYNYRLGYHVNSNYSVSIGMDHMKYVVQQGQMVGISGTISGTEGVYDGTYTEAPIMIQPDLLQFEHTDGLNYANIEVRRHNDLFTYRHFTVGMAGGLGIGALYPKTNATLLGKATNDQFHFSGYGVSAVAGLNFEFYRIFFIQSEMKGGFIHMPDIRTTASRSDRADQRFFFGQLNLVFGASFRLWKPRKDEALVD